MSTSSNVRLMCWVKERPTIRKPIPKTVYSDDTGKLKYDKSSAIQVLETYLKLEAVQRSCELAQSQLSKHRTELVSTFSSKEGDKVVSGEDQAWLGKQFWHTVTQKRN